MENLTPETLVILLSLGALGGLVAALARGLRLPRIREDDDGSSNIEIGFLGDIIIGAIAAPVVWVFNSLTNNPEGAFFVAFVTGTLGVAALQAVSSSDAFKKDKNFLVQQLADQNDIMEQIRKLKQEQEQLETENQRLKDENAQLEQRRARLRDETFDDTIASADMLEDDDDEEQTREQ